MLVRDLAPPGLKPAGDTKMTGTSCEITLLSGDGVCVWTDSKVPNVTEAKCELVLSPNAAAVIGRQQGGVLEYLDTAYQPTQIVPGTTESILHSHMCEKDSLVSRGHFMLRGTSAGILFVNGVPRRGGGIRPPMNGTWMLEPDQRFLAPAEEYFIDTLKSMTIRLPNRAVLCLRAG